MKKGLVDINFLLDMTGSMMPRRNDAIGGFNQFIKEQKAIPGEALLSFFTFNSEIGLKSVFENKNLKDVNDITENDYFPNSMTPLLDSLGDIIEKIGKRLDFLQEDAKPEKVVVAVMTDGEENFSQKFNLKKVAEMVKHQQDKYNWLFVFLGANIDSFANSASLGIKFDPKYKNVVNYAHTCDGYRAAYSSMGETVTMWRTEDVKA